MLCACVKSLSVIDDLFFFHLSPPVPPCITKAIKQIVKCIRYDIPLIVMYITVNAVVIGRGERDCIPTVCYLLTMIMINY